MQRLKGLSSVIQKLLGVWTIQAVKKNDQSQSLLLLKILKK